MGMLFVLVCTACSAGPLVTHRSKRKEQTKEETKDKWKKQYKSQHPTSIIDAKLCDIQCQKLFKICGNDMCLDKLRNVYAKLFKVQCLNLITNCIKNH